MNVKGSVNGNLLTLVIDLKAKPVVSKSEAAKALEQKREPVATQIATTGGFMQFENVKVSLNAMVA